MNRTNEEIKELQVAKVLCENNLMFHTKYFFKQLRGSKFLTNWHHEKICEELQKVERYETIFLNINMPPRMSKTELAAINFISRGLAKNPTGNYLYITASDELRSETSTRIRDIVTHPDFIDMFGVELKKDQKGKNLWRTKQGGGLKTATIFGQITGFGAGKMKDHDEFEELEDYLKDFDGCIVLDDINKIDDSTKMNSNNDKVIRILFNTVLSRKNSKDTPIINIQQRAGMDDASARLLKYFGDNDKVVNLVLPVIYNDEPLWANKMGWDEINSMRNDPETKYVFETQYMQNPRPMEGLVLPPDELYWDADEYTSQPDSVTLSFIDPADEGTDYTAMPICEIYGGKVWITDVFLSQIRKDEAEPLILAKIDVNKINETWIESNSSAYFIKNISDKSKFPVRGKRNTKNKMHRMYAQSGFIIKHFHFKSKSKDQMYNKFMDLATRVTIDGGGNQVDDPLDALAGLSALIQSKYLNLLEVK